MASIELLSVNVKFIISCKYESRKTITYTFFEQEEERFIRHISNRGMVCFLAGSNKDYKFLCEIPVVNDK
jgi:hypothetical protein